jgi:hypothetical protein
VFLWRYSNDCYTSNRLPRTLSYVTSVEDKKKNSINIFYHIMCVFLCFSDDIIIETIGLYMFRLFPSFCFWYCLSRDKLNSHATFKSVCSLYVYRFKPIRFCCIFYLFLPNYVCDMKFKLKNNLLEKNQI